MTIFDTFTAVALRRSTHPAIEDQASVVTFRDLHREALLIAGALAPASRVVLLFDDRIRAITATPFPGASAWSATPARL